MRPCSAEVAERALGATMANEWVISLRQQGDEAWTIKTYPPIFIMILNAAVGATPVGPAKVTGPWPTSDVYLILAVRRICL